MPRYTVYGYVTASVVATVEAENEADARLKASELDTPTENPNWHPDLADGAWHFNGWDDPPDDVIQEVHLDEDDDGA